jgi:hypothetical protein
MSIDESTVTNYVNTRKTSDATRKAPINCRDGAGDKLPQSRLLLAGNEERTSGLHISAAGAASPQYFVLDQNAVAMENC